MPVAYHVAIEKTVNENSYHINWTDSVDKVSSFEQSSSDILPEEIEWSWKDRRNQLGIGNKLFRFLDGDGGYLNNMGNPGK